MPHSRVNCLPEQSDLFMKHVKFLEDPQTNRKLILVGTLNSSSILAERTKQLMEIAKPDQVLVETDHKWFKQMDTVFKGRNPQNHEIQEFATLEDYSVANYKNYPRNIVFKLKYYPWLYFMKHMFPLTNEKENATYPGLEVFNATRWAEENNKHVVYSGKMFNNKVLKQLRLEKRMNFLPLAMRGVFGLINNQWLNEYEHYTKMIDIKGIERYSEGIEETDVNWMIHFYDFMMPYQKQIFIDHEDDRLFNTIHEKMTGNVNLALVNLWHLPGIEHRWRHATQTDKELSFINPIGDFDINYFNLGELENAYLQRTKAGKAKSEPAVTSEYLTSYNKQNLECERERHVFFEGWNDPELEHGLYNGENENVKNLPYKMEKH